jgi:hypothetical protein
VRFWDPATGKERGSLKGFPGEVSGFWFVPGDTILITESRVRKSPIFILYRKTFQLWDLATGKELTALRPAGSRLRRLELSRDGKFLATETVPEGKEPGPPLTRVWRLDALDVQATLPNAETSHCLTFSPDGKFLVSGHGGWFMDGTATVWDATTGRRLATLGSHKQWVETAVFTPDGRTLATANQVEVKLWDAVTWQELFTLPGSVDTFFARRGRTLLSAGKLFQAAIEAEVRDREGQGGKQP